MPEPIRLASLTMSETHSARFNPWRLGIVVATAITLGGWAIMTALDKRAQPPELEMVEVCVAAKDLPVGTTITAEDAAKLITRARFPKDSVPEGVVVDEAQVHDKRIARPWRKGEMFIRQDLVTRGSVHVLPPWRVGITIQYLTGDTFVSFRDYVAVSATIRRGSELERIVLARKGFVIEQLWGDPYSEATVIVEGEANELFELAKARGCEFSMISLDLTQIASSKPVDAKHTKQLLESLPAKAPPSEP